MKKLVLLCIVFIIAANNLLAQAGLPDPSFGKNGIITANAGAPFDYGYAHAGYQVLVTPGGALYFINQVSAGMAVVKRLANGLPDSSYGDHGSSKSAEIFPPYAAAFTAGDKIVVVGSFKNSQSGDDFGVVRFNADGTLDSSFNGNGVSVTNLGRIDNPNSVAIQTDGKIVVAGISREDGSYTPYFELIRYNTDGSVDVNLEKQNNKNAGGYYNAVAIQSDGKIVAAGETADFYEGSSNIEVDRYNTDLSLDTSFSGDGKQSDPGSRLQSNSMAIQSDGKILVAGSVLLRYNIDGTSDNTFDGDGKKSLNINFSALAIQPDGKFLLGGSLPTATATDFALYRYYSNGNTDSTFGQAGRVLTDFDSGDDFINSLAVLSDGKLIALGSTQSASSTNPAAARYNADGNPDNSFGLAGKMIDKTNVVVRNTVFTSTAVQKNGKVVAAGNAWNGSNWDFVLARYNPDGHPDSTFAGNGVKLIDFSGRNDYANSVVLESDGKILVGGASNNDFALARFMADGSADSSFGANGLQTTDFGGTDIIKKIALTSDGKIIAGGGTTLARYNADGSPDPGFGGSFQNITDLAIQADGKIVVTGIYNGFGEFNGVHLVARYNQEGSIDYSFGGTGFYPLDDNSLDEYIGTSVEIQKDGRIVVGGYYQFSYRNSYLSNFAIFRLNTDGTLDSSFGGGLVQTNVQKFSKGLALKIQKDNRIIIAGTSNNGSNDDDFTLLRYNTDGTPDGTFNNSALQITRVSEGSDELTGLALGASNLYAVGYSSATFTNGVIVSYQLGETSQTPTVNLTVPANNASYLAGGNVYLTATAADADGAISKVAFYNDTTLLYTATDTPYTVKWEHVRKGNYSLFAIATDNSGLTAISDTVHIRVFPNMPPHVTLSNPAPGQTFLSGSTLHLQAAATDTDGRITKVEFYADTILLATEHKLPYTFNWKVSHPGNYLLTAKATDNWGAITASVPVQISVVPNQPPVVSLVTPLDSQVFTAPATINLEAIARDADGRIITVRFYDGTTLLSGNEHKAPYTSQWQNVAVGTYTIFAVAKDNWNAETKSAPVTITVIPAGQPLVSSQRRSSAGDAGFGNETGLQLFPDPAQHILNIRTAGLSKNNPSVFSIISAFGAAVKMKKINRVLPMFQWDISSLASGTYTLKIINGPQVIYRQFVKL